MEEVPLTRAYLETLTTGELVKLADTHGVDVSPDLERIFIIAELLDIAALNRNEDSPETEMTDLVFTESAPLPKQYNITFLEVMIRDPLWALVFWEIKAQDKEQFEKTPDFTGYYLKVTSLDKSADAAQQGVFTVQVKTDDTAWYLGLNAEEGDGIFRPEQCSFKVELCAGFGEGETVIAGSNPVKLPGLPPSKAEKQESSGPWENPLVCLSGYGDFHILRRNEKLFRAKRGGAAANGMTGVNER